MREVDYNEEIPKVEFVFARMFMDMKHNYLCAVCKEKSAVQDTHTGILQPCWDCQKTYKVKKLTWLDRIFK